MRMSVAHAKHIGRTCEAMTWHPISLAGLQTMLSRDLAECSVKQRKFFTLGLTPLNGTLCSRAEGKRGQPCNRFPPDLIRPGFGGTGVTYQLVVHSAAKAAETRGQDGSCGAGVKYPLSVNPAARDSQTRVSKEWTLPQISFCNALSDEAVKQWNPLPPRNP